MKRLAPIATTPFTSPAISPVLRKGVGKPLLHIYYAFRKLSINASRVLKSHILPLDCES